MLTFKCIDGLVNCLCSAGNIVQGAARTINQLLNEIDFGFENALELVVEFFLDSFQAKADRHAEPDSFEQNAASCGPFGKRVGSRTPLFARILVIPETR